MSHHNSFVMVVNAAMGGGEKTAPPKPGDPGVRDLAAGHATAEAAAAAINAAMCF
jgi:hypothetical protein